MSITAKPTAWRIERFSKRSGKREHDETEYDAAPSPDFLANMGRTWRVVVTPMCKCDESDGTDADTKLLAMGGAV